MKRNGAETDPCPPRLRPMTYVAAFAVAFTVSQTSLADGDHVTPPNVSPSLQVPAENTPFREGAAIGTQDYICLPSSSGFAWTFFGPQATLFNKRNEQIITHFLSPNPFENGTPRATWQDSEDTSKIWGLTVAPVTVHPDAIPWLLLHVVGGQNGPTGGSKLSATTFVQRVNTVGGVAPSTGCAASEDVGKMALVPYSADYFFYQAVKHVSSR